MKYPVGTIIEHTPSGNRVRVLANNVNNSGGDHVVAYQRTPENGEGVEFTSVGSKLLPHPVKDDLIEILELTGNPYRAEQVRSGELDPEDDELCRQIMSRMILKKPARLSWEKPAPPTYTTDGRTVRLICTDRNDPKLKLLGLTTDRDGYDSFIHGYADGRISGAPHLRIIPVEFIDKVVIILRGFGKTLTARRVKNGTGFDDLKPFLALQDNN